MEKSTTEKVSYLVNSLYEVVSDIESHGLEDEDLKEKIKSDILLYLIRGMNKDEVKAILGHEFGHFSQQTMKVGSMPKWLEFNPETLEGKILANPTREDIADVTIKENMIVELYSK